MIISLHRMLYLLLSVFGSAQIFSSCSSPGNLLSQKDDEKKEDTGEDGEDTPADTPVQVTGAFLKVLCDADGFAVDANYNIDSSPVVACIIKNDDDTRYTKSLESVISEVFKSGGVPVTSETQIAVSPPWHFYIKTSPEERKDIVTGNFKIVSSGQTEEVSTEKFDYKWYEDPFIKGLVAVLTATPQRSKIEGGIASMLGPNKDKLGMVHMIFTTDEFFAGDVTLEKADAHCDAVGDKQVAPRVWRAVLGSSTKTARERIPIAGRVYNLYGNHLSAYPDPAKPGPDYDEAGNLRAGFWEDAFWDLAHVSNVEMTPSGKRVHLFDEVDGLLRVVDFAWTGMLPGGATDTQGGTCADWTTAAVTATGTVGNVMSRDAKLWANKKKNTCDTKARLLCISLQEGFDETP